LRDTDLLVRLGGDEFLIALPGVSSLDSAAHVADKLRAVLRESISTPDTVWNVSASIGVVVAEVDQPLADAITRADRAMYAAKAGGRDRTVTA
jgi:diguanylate cyclase (GGDEF)-like protein